MIDYICPKCGHRMHVLVLASIPAIIEIRCEHCGYVYRVGGIATSWKVIVPDEESNKDYDNYAKRPKKPKRGIRTLH